MFDFLETNTSSIMRHAQRIIVAENKRLINVNHEEKRIKKGGGGDVHAE